MGVFTMVFPGNVITDFSQGGEERDEGMSGDVRRFPVQVLSYLQFGM
jgi:hypothetical protein